MTLTKPHNGTETSYAAAQNSSLSKSKQDRRDICFFATNQAAHGVTDEELHDALPHIDVNALRARRIECWGKNYLTDSVGEKRLSKAGHPCKVYHVTSKFIKRMNLPTETFCIKVPE